MEFINIADLKNPETGKTYRQENHEKKHKLSVGDLVEIVWEDEDYKGIRLFIIGCVRDCDGTPLYVLGSKDLELYQSVFVKPNTFYNFKAISGMGEGSIKLIKKHKTK